jgi:tRNA A37 threonylcarbamoyladenosine biosynthesis protein TsaE
VLWVFGSFISSPTYIIESEYNIPAVDDSYLSNRKTFLYHMDVWRLFEAKELEELEFYQKVDGANVFVIEWADKITDILENIKAEAIVLWVEIDYGIGEFDRVIRVSDFG